MNKSEIRIKILDIQDKECSGCEIKRELFEKYEENEAGTRLQRHCITNCKVGERLRELGKKLEKRPKIKIENDKLREENINLKRTLERRENSLEDFKKKYEKLKEENAALKSEMNYLKRLGGI